MWSSSALRFIVLSLLWRTEHGHSLLQSLLCLICLECVDNHVVNNYIKFVSFQYSDEWKNTFRCSDKINLFKRWQVNHLKNRMVLKSLGVCSVKKPQSFQRVLSHMVQVSLEEYMQINKLVRTFSHICYEEIWIGRALKQVLREAGEFPLLEMFRSCLGKVLSRLIWLWSSHAVSRGLY